MIPLLSLAVLSPVVTYRVEITSNGKADFMALPGAQNVPKTEIHSRILGTLELMPAGRNYAWLGQFHPKEFTLDGEKGRMNEAENGLSRELNTQLLVEFDRSGRIREFRLSPRLSSTTVRLLAAVLENFQFARSPVTREEATSAGTFTYRYRKLGNQLEKQVLPSKSATSSDRPVPRLSGSATALLTREVAGLPVQTLTGRYELTTVWRQHEVSRTVTVVSINRLNVTSGKLAVGEVRLLQTCPAHQLYEAPSATEINRTVQTNELGQSTTEEVLAPLKELGATKESGKDLTPIYLKLNALLTLRPWATSDLDPIFFGSSLDSAAFQIITRSLGAVGNDACQALLISTLKQKLADPGWVSRLLAATTRLKNPNLDSESFVRGLSSGPEGTVTAGMATMVLGAFARSLATTAPTRSHQISQELLKRLESAKDTSSQIRLLGALGNIGSQETMTACMEFLKSDQIALREEATSGLRFVRFSVVQDLLINLLATDPAAGVRSNAIYALSFRPVTPSLIQALLASLQDTDRGVRASVLSLLSGHIEEYPSVKSAIKRVSTHDPDKDIRAQAAKVLSQSSGHS